MSIVWEQYAAENNLHYENSILFGWRDGFFFTLSGKKGKWRLNIYFPQNTNEQSNGTGDRNSKLLDKRANVGQTFTKSLSEFGLEKSYQISNDQSMGVFFKGRLEEANVLNELLAHLFSGLSKLGLCSEKVCYHCHRVLDDQSIPVQYGEDIYPMHEFCCSTQGIKPVAVDKPFVKINSKRSTLAGLLGATLGAILGAIPWIILNSIGFIASISGLISGWLIEKGYTLFGGRQGRYVRIMLILFVFVSFILGYFLYNSYLVLQELAKSTDLTVSRMEYISLFWKAVFTSPDLKGVLLKDLGLGLLFALLGGSVILKKYSSSTNQHGKPKRLTSVI